MEGEASEEEKRWRSFPTLRKVFKSAYSLAKAELSSIPGLGGAAVSLLNDYEAQRKARKMEEWMNRVECSIRDISGEVEKLLEMESNLPDFLFENMQAYVSSGEEAKKDFLVGLAHTSIVDSGGRTPEIDFFQRKLEVFSGVHLDLLRLYYSPQKAFEHKGLDSKLLNSDLKGLIEVYVANADFEIVRAAQNDLHSAKLVVSDGGTFGVLTAASGFQRASSMLTPLGRRLVEVCHPWLK